MSPRSYRMEQRQEAAAQTRAQILTAARDVLSAPEGIAAFTIDAVARQAGVARMTVYYQFGSKVKLLEALADDLAERGQMERQATAFQQPDALDALDRYIGAFAHAWNTDRLILRRLRALGALDPDIATVIHARDQRRRTGVGVLLTRLRTQGALPQAVADDDVADALFTLTSFETFDTLAGPERSIEEIAPLVQRLARAALVSGSNSGTD